jgi:hypothetical protein
MANQTGSSRFHALFESAFQAYEKKTGISLAEHPLFVQLQSFDSVESTTTLLQNQTQAFREFRGSDRVKKLLKNTVLIVATLSTKASLGDTIGLVCQKSLMASPAALTFSLQPFPPATAIHAGLAILLSVCAILLLLCGYHCDIQMNQAASGVTDSYDALVDLLEFIENVLSRLDIYMRIPPTPAMDDVVVKILVGLLSTLALATKELKQGRSSLSVFVGLFLY